MSDLGNVNSFGNLTRQTWQKVKENFDNIDTNQNGALESEELNSFLDSLNLPDTETLDSVTFSSIARTSTDDKAIDIDELELQDKKMEMQDEVNSYRTRISTTFIGKYSSVGQTVLDSLKTFMEEYVNKNITSLDIEQFKTALETEYNKIVEDYFPTTDSAKQRAKSAAIDEAMKGVSKEDRANAYEVLSKEADSFIETYNGNDMLKDALAEHLKAFLKQTDGTKVNDEKTVWTDAVAETGEYVDETELETLKQKAIEVLEDIINKDVEITFNGTTFDKGNIDEVSTEVNSFEDGEELKTAMDKAIKSLNSTTELGKIKKTTQDQKAQAEAEKNEKISKATSNVIKEMLKEHKIPDKYSQRLGAIIDKFAQQYAKDHPDFTQTTLEAAIKTHLDSIDASDISADLNNYNSAVKNYQDDAYIDDNEFKQIKKDATALLTAMINAGVEIKIDDTVYSDLTTKTISSFINQFDDGKALLDAMNKVIANAQSDTSRIKKFAAQVKKEEDAAEAKRFAALTGEDFTISLSGAELNTTIDGYLDNREILRYGDDEGDSKIRCKNDDKTQANLKKLKDMMAEKLKKTCESKDIKFERVQNLFEKYFDQSVDEFFNSISSDDRTWHDPRAWYNVQDMVNSIVSNVNTKLTSTINEINASQTDMDTADIDTKALGTNEQGKTESFAGVSLDQAYNRASDEPLVQDEWMDGKSDADYQNKIKEAYNKANAMIDRLKQQMLAKAKTMCEANGVKFDSTKFDELFESAKSAGVTSGVTCEKYTAKGGGWNIGIASHHVYHPALKITLNVKGIVNTFLETFKNSYTAWIDGQ